MRTRSPTPKVGVAARPPRAYVAGMHRATGRLWVLGLAVVLLSGLPGRARACGLSPPIGPNGLPTVCHGDDAGLRFRVGLTAGGTDTRIEIGDRKADLLQAATIATLDVIPLERLALSAAAGASLGGRVDFEGQRYDLAPGPIGGVGASYRLLGGALPFVHLSATLSLSRTIATAPDDSESTFTSRDWRFGVAVGKAIGTVAAPFAVARYFGGGTDWSAFGKGADDYRYHVGVGSAFGISEHFDALAELTFLGERRATLGAGYLF